jgi:hypothetical protein
MFLLLVGRSIFKNRSTCYFVRVGFGGRLVRRLIVELIVDRVSIAPPPIEVGVDRLGFGIFV